MVAISVRHYRRPLCAKGRRSGSTGSTSQISGSDGLQSGSLRSLTVSLPPSFRGWFARLPKPRVEFRYLATEDPMATQIVMDRTGRHHFDANNADALLEAKERFMKLTGAGFTAAVRTASGEAVVKRTFDPTAEETLFFPRLVGG